MLGVYRGRRVTYGRCVMTRRALVVLAAIFVASLVTAVPSAFAGGGGHCRRDVTEAKGNAVEMKDACFTPTILHVQPGDDVTWVSRDSLWHVVVGAGRTWGRFEEMENGDRVTFRFDRAGVYPYTCYLHAGMNGAIIVGEVKAPSATIQDLGVGVPTEIANPQPPTDSGTAPVSSTSSASASQWPAAWFAGLGILLGATGTLFAQRYISRRSRVSVPAG
jgi:plastocyanin